MVWITWRQHRAALIGMAILLGACALALGITGLRMQAARASLVRSGCGLFSAPITSGCGSLQSAYFRAGYPLTSNISLLIIVLSIIPGVVGIFVGAPLLARELEAGTYRFAWTQATSRTRWVVAKLLLVGGTLTAAGGAFGALAGWWLLAADPEVFASRWQAGQFGLTAVTFAAWTLLAFALGAFAGALIRRTVPAMAATAASVAALAGATAWKLSNLLISVGPVIHRAALLTVTPFNFSPDAVSMPGGGMVIGPASSRVLRTWFTGPHGQTYATYSSSMNPLWNLKEPSQHAWLASHHLTLWIAYQPAGRFWIFQSIEGAAGLLLAVLLGAAAVFVVRRKAG
jgi:ABC-type transport system involved in multi-copper enzyme maturation permease subunit